MNFDKDKFAYSGTRSEVWVHYEGEFIGRFKYARAKSSAKDFVKFLAKNFTVEEYFEKRKSISPLLILKEKGYVSLNVRKARESA